ncbi:MULTISPECIES: polysaccharide biosynthesis C-terminal domain-containing protein [unclassified Marinobacter]|uniref:polysaccharide biosynthesis C-terminal domain-containing protein n=1 Tax=unclassified Marinobacter TaxID=83889 RepID=UPI00200CA791|nr:MULTISPECIES: polysaccharide biosynthesis C-terminal domain-containing protein [unclassified Marinobacter]UQG57164.1 oligosaccharide flippase family protein [Marinobacter sp. M4C]UQG65968.1 oligosaccharide flippase family protein [Marinobacter sp. M2C]UQG70248.1 oligosaccharide flippase family protein [Marinobacter sp. M1C]
MSGAHSGRESRFDQRFPYGVFGIVVSQVIGSFLALIPNTYFSARLVGYSLIDQVKDVIKPIFAALVSGFASWCFVEQGERSLPLWIVGGGLVGLATYIAVSLLIRVEGIGLLLKKVKARKATIV